MIIGGAVELPGCKYHFLRVLTTTMAVAGVLAGHVVKRDAYQDGLLPDNNIISDFYDQRATGQ